MVLTQEDRVQLLMKAREAKKAKQQASKEEVTVKVELPVEEPPTPKPKKSRKKAEIAPLPEPVHVIQESESEEEVIEVPIPIPKKKTIPNPKWLKQIKTEPEKVCCDKKLTKETPVIDDEPQVVTEKIVIPSKSTIKKPRAPRASTRTLDIVEPTPIEDVLEDVKNNNQKYLPKVRQATPASAPISIKYHDPPLQIFQY
jgi:hypothetical protein